MSPSNNLILSHLLCHKVWAHYFVTNLHLNTSSWGNCKQQFIYYWKEKYGQILAWWFDPWAIRSKRDRSGTFLRTQLPPTSKLLCCTKHWKTKKLNEKRLGWCCSGCVIQTLTVSNDLLSSEIENSGRICAQLLDWIENCSS